MDLICLSVCVRACVRACRVVSWFFEGRTRAIRNIKSVCILFSISTIKTHVRRRTQSWRERQWAREKEEREREKKKRNKSQIQFTNDFRSIKMLFKCTLNANKSFCVITSALFFSCKHMNEQWIYEYEYDLHLVYVRVNKFTKSKWIIDIKMEMSRFSIEYTMEKNIGSKTNRIN